jgi:hypothetical protein
MPKKLFLILSLIWVSPAIATVPVDAMVSLCSPYPEINDQTSFPKSFNSTNNLTRPADSAFYEAEGKKITIKGRVMELFKLEVHQGDKFFPLPAFLPAF